MSSNCGASPNLIPGEIHQSSSVLLSNASLTINNQTRLPCQAIRFLLTAIPKDSRIADNALE